MSLPTRSLSSNLRHPSANSQTNAQSPALIARINEKRVELDNLTQLRDLSAGLAAQMQTLEDKLATLADGTEAVATVLSNWHNVLRAIHMASIKIPRPKSETHEDDTERYPEVDGQLPQTLVRIPTKAADTADMEEDTA